METKHPSLQVCNLSVPHPLGNQKARTHPKKDYTLRFPHWPLHKLYLRSWLETLRHASAFSAHCNSHCKPPIRSTSSMYNQLAWGKLEQRIARTPRLGPQLTPHIWFLQLPCACASCSLQDRRKRCTSSIRSTVASSHRCNPRGIARDSLQSLSLPASAASRKGGHPAKLLAPPAESASDIQFHNLQPSGIRSSSPNRLTCSLFHQGTLHLCSSTPPPSSGCSLQSLPVQAA
mmetsp:Transcript_41691/g.77949  ORF Transcript_41691/g.77949 Transcript_41691/m.77949 type:complete len:232 (+) Transcript_41691:773-1468(+)